MEVSTFFISGAIDDALVKSFMEWCDAEGRKGTTQFSVLINSHGGEEHAARAIAGIIASCSSPVIFHTYGYGQIESCAVLIFAAGKQRYLSKYASIMVHESCDEVEATSSAMKAHAKHMERNESAWCKALQTFTGTDEKTWMKLHEDETYLMPDEALKLNLATELI